MVKDYCVLTTCRPDVTQRTKPGPPGCRPRLRDDENNSNRPNPATTTPEDVPSNNEDKEPKDEIEVHKVPLPSCRPDENKKKQQKQHREEEKEESSSSLVSTLAFQKVMDQCNEDLELRITNRKNANMQKLLESMWDAIDAEINESTQF